MLLWLKANLATIIISAVILIGVFFIIRSMLRAKREGKNTCSGGSCSTCQISGYCRSYKDRIPST